MGQEVKRSKKSVTESHPSMSVYSVVMDSINIPSTKSKKEKSIFIQHVQTYYSSLSNRENLLALHCIEYHKPSRDGVIHVYRKLLPRFHGNGLAVPQGNLRTNSPLILRGAYINITGCR